MENIRICDVIVDHFTIKKETYLPYRISPPISPGFIRVRKGFLLGLSARGLIRGGEGGLICGSNKAGETTDITRQNENLCFKK